MTYPRAKKRFGQHFLIDDNILRKIVSAAELDRQTGVIEIGPGRGALTDHLLDAAGGILAYEIDRNLASRLSPRFEGENNTLIVGDVLQADIENDLSRHLGGFESIVALGNLPYNITTPIMMRFLEENIPVERMIFMMQKEVAERITGQPKTKDYNALSVLVDYRAEVTKLFNVSRHVFRPKPRVDSAVVRLDVRSNPKVKVKDETFFINMVRAAFRQRRKTCVNNLTAHFTSMAKSDISMVMEDMGYSPKIRSEALSTEDFAALANRFYDCINHP